MQFYVSIIFQIRLINQLFLILLIGLILIFSGCGPNKFNEGIDVQVKLTGITWDGIYLYGTDGTTNELVKFDLNNKKIIKTYSVNHECIRGIFYYSGLFWITTCTGQVVTTDDSGVIKDVLNPQNYSDDKPDFYGIVIVDYRVFILDKNKLVEFDSDLHYVTDYLLPSKFYRGITYDYENLVLTSIMGKLLYFDFKTGDIISEEKVAGPMKISDVCWDGEKLWFSSPKNQKLYNLTEE